MGTAKSDRPVLNLEDVAHIAELARLALAPEEPAKMLVELNSVLTMAAALDEVDTTDLPETHHVTGLTNVWRDDVATDTLLIEDVFSNAPRHAGGHFNIPKPL